MAPANLPMLTTHKVLHVVGFTKNQFQLSRGSCAPERSTPRMRTGILAARTQISNLASTAVYNIASKFVKPFSKNILGMSPSFFFLLVGMLVFSIAAVHWPWKSKVGFYIFTIGLAAWYLWRFFWIPFRAGARAKHSDGGDS